MSRSTRSSKRQEIQPTLRRLVWIRSHDTCVELGIKHPFASCNPCANREELNARGKPIPDDGSKYYQRFLKCERPWDFDINDRGISKSQAAMHQKAWVCLHKLGYQNEDVEQECTNTASTQASSADTSPIKTSSTDTSPHSNKEIDIQLTSVETDSDLTPDVNILAAALLAKRNEVSEEKVKRLEYLLSTTVESYDTCLRSVEDENIRLKLVMSQAVDCLASNPAAPSESNNHSNNTVSTQANYRQTVCAPYLSRVKNQASRAREMERQAVANRYSHGTDMGESLYKGAIAMMPRGSQKAMEFVFLLSKADVLADANVNIRNLDDISGSTPPASKISEWVYDGAADSKFLASQEILSKKCKVYLICDKGALKTAQMPIL
jgi:hypothetical protein